mgnify:CR=1 FL=1
MEEIKVNEKAVERLKRKIILQESQNLKTREKTDQQMVAWINRLRRKCNAARINKT